MSDRRVVFLAMLGFLALLLVGPFWAFPHVEAKLRAAATLEEPELAEESGYRLEWHGRDGYLRQADHATDAMDVSALVARLEAIPGVRNVEVVDIPPLSVTGKKRAKRTKGGLSTGAATARTEADAATETRQALVPTAHVAVDAGPGNAGTFASHDEATSHRTVFGEVQGAKVRSAGQARSAAALKRASRRLAGLDATLELGLTDFAAAQAAIDDLLRLNRLEFENASIEPTPGTVHLLDDIAAVLLEHSAVHVDVIGHTDSRGGTRSNQQLSERRAEVVVRGLEERGVARERLHASGKGERQPLASNRTVEGQRLNRRVDFLVRKGI